MIPRLWVCTSHPFLHALSAPLHPLAILCLIVCSSVVAALSGRGAALRVRRLWQSLLIANVGGFVPTALAGWVVYKLGGHPNAIFVAARYLWVGLSLSALVAGFYWGRRGVAALDAGKAQKKARSVLDLPGIYAAGAFLLWLPHVFVAQLTMPWSLPYELADWCFDVLTNDIASDECLAFRSVDDQQIFWPHDPGTDAALHLKSYGPSAIPAISAFLSEQIQNGPHAHIPTGVVGLCALVASYGDSPILRAYEPVPAYGIGKMRTCVREGKRVHWLSTGSWACRP